MGSSVHVDAVSLPDVGCDVQFNYLVWTQAVFTQNLRSGVSEYIHSKLRKFVKLTHKTHSFSKTSL